MRIKPNDVYWTLHAIVSRVWGSKQLSSSRGKASTMQSAKLFGLVFFVMWGSITCGSSAGSNAVSGSVSGTKLDITNAFAVYSSNTSDPNDDSLSILMSSSSALCSLLMQGHLPKSSQFGEIDLAVVDATGAQAPTEAGTFTVYTVASASSITGDSANIANFAIGQTTADANCMPANVPTATSGTVNLTALGSRTANTLGTYNVTLNTNDVVSGSFTAIPCILDAAVFDAPSGSATCE